MGRFGVGQPLRRVEDQRFLTGGGRYSDDIELPGQARAVLVRSPYAHGEIRGIDTAEAAAAPGVLGVYTADDLSADGIGDIPCLMVIPGKNGSTTTVPPHPALARDRVRYVGDPVALVVAETHQQARDAAELVALEVETLPAVIEAVDAVAPDAPQIWQEAPGNISLDWEIGDKAATDAAFASAPRVTRITLVHNRLVPSPIEARGALGEYDPESGEITLTTGTQGGMRMRPQLAGAIFKVEDEKVRIVTPDVGGSFGMKIFLYPEQVAVLFAARRLGRPVKWSADRSESFLSDTHGRDQVVEVEMATDEEGRFLALRSSGIANMGAYLSNYAPLIPTGASGKMFSGLYAIPAVYMEVKCVFTNTVPVDAYRGAGRPEAAYIVERLVDAVARDLGLSQDEIRRRNFIRPEQLPYTTATDIVYDSGDYLQVMQDAMAKADWAGFEERRREARARGKLRGIGMACYIEACGAIGAEAARLRLDEDGGVTVFIGTQTNGQGHATAYAQLVNERMDIEPGLVRLRQGDTGEWGEGGGTGGSRSLMMGGLALGGAMDQVIERARAIAGHLLEAAEADLELRDGGFTVAGTDRRVTLAEIARQAGTDGLPEALRGTVEGTHRVDSLAEDGPGMTYPNGCHVCELEVDEATGMIEILRFVVFDDIGKIVNPLLVAGQVYGGVVQGIGQAIHERTVYDEDGQLLTGSFMDYGLPRADDLAPVELTLVEDYPCKTNPMGIKGAGEVGTIGAPPAVMNALLEALSPVGVTRLDMPATPERVWRAMQDAKASDRQAAE